MNTLKELKKSIQSINNSITDENIDTLQRHLIQLETPYKKDPNVTQFLAMMRSMGKYLIARKNTAHQGSLQVLNSIADQLDYIICHPDLEKEKVREILSEEVKKYKFLKNQISSNPLVHETDIQNLKAVILSMDWEISITTLQNFETVVTPLLKKFKAYKIHHTFLKIIHSTGRYIGIQKANAPADSISFLRSVFENFERVTQTPDMSFKDKQQILETDINRFYEFKHKISLKKKIPGQMETAREEESMAPALSHIKKISRPEPGDMTQLTTLPAQENLLTGNTPNPDDVGLEPATKKTLEGPRDVMDDLFNMKDSPADDLLDAIHLLDVQGSGKDHPLNMLDSDETVQSKGIKNFTSQKMGNDPIPEIETRLDEFFNLEIPPDNGGMTDHKNHDAALPEDIGSAILNRLRATIEDSEWLRYDASMLSIREDISFLEKHWQDTTDKACLIQILSLIITQLEQVSPPIESQKNGRAETSDKRGSNPPPKKPEGIWEKVKRLFIA